MLWCLAASGVYSLFGPFLSLPNEFLAGFSAAAGIALINSIGNLGGFVDPYAMGAINKITGSFRGGLVFAGISLFTAAILLLAQRSESLCRRRDARASTRHGGAKVLPSVAMAKAHS
jgi:MFS transporter, ACS family, tartrate transporter